MEGSAPGRHFGRSYMNIAKLAAASAVSALALGYAQSAQAEDLTLCWASWDPANALVELSKDFEAKSGHTMNFEFVITLI